MSGSTKNEGENAALEKALARLNFKPRPLSRAMSGWPAPARVTPAA